MENSTLSMLKQIYGATGTPVAVVNCEYDVLWKNSAAEACGFYDDRFFAELGKEAAEGVKSVFVNGAYHLFNVMKLGEEGFAIEYVGKDSARDVSHMRDYFDFLCARLRDSSSQISMAADDIDMFVKNGDTDIASSLNRINKNVMLLLKEALVPENIFYAAECADESLNLAHAVALSAEDAQNVLGRQSEVWQNAVDDVCANINGSVFDTVISYMTAYACGGELYPERVEYVVERDGENKCRGFVSVRSVCLSGRRNMPFKLEAMKKKDFFTETAFKDMLAGKYGMTFETRKLEDGIECIVYLDVLPENKGIVRTRNKLPRQERFSSMAVSLSEKHCAEHYKNIKME
ncbi:MAG: hypothetical protein J6A05_01855 [Oscillospiraceae bacterium]|nr:hypothetical protein [Oscillospiraceae bacterium]